MTSMSTQSDLTPPVSGWGAPQAVRAWVSAMAELCQPTSVVWCHGTDAERKRMTAEAVEQNILLPLNPQKLPGCFLHRSHPNDVARSEQCTYICTPGQDAAGPTNRWMSSHDAYQTLSSLFRCSMRRRTMYVVPFVMGPVGSPLARVGVQLTDSLYVAISMSIMTRMGDIAWTALGPEEEDFEFTRCLHSIGSCDPDRRYICHFPLDNTIWSFGSGYGGNALLGKKCLALRIASYLGRQEGWMAEHMLVAGVTSPGGEKTYVAAAFPSACGKTNFAMLIPSPAYRAAGWKVSTVADDIAWMWVDPATRKLRAINPENGYFGVLPGTNSTTNPNAMASMSHDTLYTNVALLPDGDVWWEGKTKELPNECIDWTGRIWTPDCGRKAAHPNSRFTAPMTNNPALDEAASDPAGVPITAIIFGGRRSTTIPLVYEAFNWLHGVYVGTTIGSETTAAAAGEEGVVRRDPMAMLPFIGYNIRDYLVHWIRMRRLMSECPRIFSVNWFRKGLDGAFLWPGFGENMRVLEWIIKRCQGRAHAIETPLGWMPRWNDLNLEGLGITAEGLAALQKVPIDELKNEIVEQELFFLKLGGDLPKELLLQRELLISSL
ncbi:MAG: phosphoenolpyruvate carboxykinase (GTP) [Phycisphaerae bacterium]